MPRYNPPKRQSAAEIAAKLVESLPDLDADKLCAQVLYVLTDTLGHTPTLGECQAFMLGASYVQECAAMVLRNEQTKAAVVAASEAAMAIGAALVEDAAVAEGTDDIPVAGSVPLTAEDFRG